MSSASTSVIVCSFSYPAALKKHWRSPIYSFFKLDAVTVEHIDGWLVHFFPCSARKCKSSTGGVRRYQDSKDKSSTTNLKHHAVACWGKEAVYNAFNGQPIKGQSGSIHAAFARQGQQPVHRTHCMHTNDEVQYGKLLTMYSTFDTTFLVLNSYAGSQRVTAQSTSSMIDFFVSFLQQDGQVSHSPLT